MITYAVVVQVMKPLWALRGERSKLGAWLVDAQGAARIFPVVLLCPSHHASDTGPQDHANIVNLAQGRSRALGQASKNHDGVECGKASS